MSIDPKYWKPQRRAKINTNFTKEMITPKLVKACREQWEKYVGKREMDDNCLICSATSLEGEGCRECDRCPLSDGSGPVCLEDSTYVQGVDREDATSKQLKARADRLLELYEQHGIDIGEKAMLTVTEEKQKVLTIGDLETNTPFLMPGYDDTLRIKSNTGYQNTLDGCHYTSLSGMDDLEVEIVNANTTWSRKK